MLGEARPDSLDFFLIERYCLYLFNDGTLFRARIHHPLETAKGGVDRLPLNHARRAGTSGSEGMPAPPLFGGAVYRYLAA
jgi:hypothetical protein